MEILQFFTRFPPEYSLNSSEYFEFSNIIKICKFYQELFGKIRWNLSQSLKSTSKFSSISFYQKHMARPRLSLDCKCFQKFFVCFVTWKLREFPGSIICSCHSAINKYSWTSEQSTATARETQRLCGCRPTNWKKTQFVIM